MADVTPAGPMAVALDSLRALIGAMTGGVPLANVFVGEVGYPIAAVSLTAQVLTVTLRDQPVENFIGQTVTLEGASLGSQGELAAAGSLVVSDQTNGVLSLALAAPDVAEFSPDFAFLLPGARPLVVLSEADGSGAGQSRWIGSGGVSVFSGSIEILLEADVPAGDFINPDRRNDAKNALTQARNDMGAFQLGLMALQDTADYMPLRDFAWVSGPEFVNRAENNDNTARFERWRALAKVSWGVEG